jgi:hypothetical protein
MGHGPKKYNPPGFAHLIAGQQSSQPKGGLGGTGQKMKEGRSPSTGRFDKLKVPSLSRDSGP